MKTPMMMAADTSAAGIIIVAILLTILPPWWCQGMPCISGFYYPLSIYMNSLRQCVFVKNRRGSWCRGDKRPDRVYSV
jgi:hypothetical protein